MTVNLPRIPDAIAAGATVTPVPDTAKNTSEGGISGRKRMRDVLRNYIVTVSPDYADEMQAIIMVAGTDKLLCMRDPIANALVNEEALIAADGLSALVGKTWAPSTGNLQVFERVLIFDGSVLIEINGVAATSGHAVLGDYGVITLSPALNPLSDTVEVTANYLRPVCMLDAPSANAFGPGQYQFHDIRLEQIFAKELIRRTS
jgi:hypothetical protein